MAERWNNSYEPSMCEKAFELFQNGRSVTQVCVALGIVRDTYYRWKKEHPEFCSAAEAGEQASQGYWEDLGEEGIRGQIDKFSGTPWMFTMKNRFRESYADQQKEKEGNTAVEMLLNLLVEKNK